MNVDALPAPPIATQPVDAATDRSATSRLATNRLADYALLTKPRVATLALAAVAVGAVAAGGSVGLPFFCAVIGGAFVAAGASIWNQLIERVADGRMERTRERPLPQGRLSLLEAGVAGSLFLAAGLVVLWLGTTPMAVAVGAATWVVYVVGYTPLKQLTPLNTLVGAVAGALPPVLGWAAMTGGLEPGAGALFAILFLWQLPHVLALGAMYADDYRAAGIRLLSIDDATGVAGRQACIAAVALLPVACWPVTLGLAGPWYLVAAIGLGLWYVAATTRWALRRQPADARRLFRVSLAYLPLLFVCLVADHVATTGGAA